LRSADAVEEEAGGTKRVISKAKYDAVMAQLTRKDKEISELRTDLAEKGA